MPNLRIKLGDPKDPDNLIETEWGDDLLTLAEAEKIERIWGGNWPDFLEALWSANARALRTLAWSILVRDAPTLRYEEVDCPRGHVRTTPLCEVCGEEVSLVVIDRRQRKLASDSTPKNDQAPGWIHEHGYVVCDAPKPAVTGGRRPLPKAPKAPKKLAPSGTDDGSTSPPSPSSTESDPGNGAS